MKFFEGEAKGADKYSAATASEALKTRSQFRCDWSARLACSEAEVKRVFTKLTLAKKKSNQEKATADLTEPDLGGASTSNTTAKRKRGRPRKVSVDGSSTNRIEDPFELLEDAQIPDSQLNINL